MTTILLARHGQASFGQENYDKLSELGIRQAQLLGAHYGATQRRIDAIFSGSLVRQKESAEHFWSYYKDSFAQSDTRLSNHIFNMQTPDSSVLPVFNEFNHRDVFIKSNSAFSNPGTIATEIAKAQVPNVRLAELFDEAMQRWHAGDNDSDYIESWTQFNKRAQSGLDTIRTQITQRADLGHDSTVLVFTSGGVIAAISAQLLEQGSQLAYTLNRKLINTGVTAITMNKGGIRLLSLNEHSHLFAGGERFVTWR